MKKIFSYRPGGLFSGDYRSFTGGIGRDLGLIADLQMKIRGPIIIFYVY